jgi:hypothetical protein
MSEHGKNHSEYPPGAPVDRARTGVLGGTLRLAGVNLSRSVLLAWMVIASAGICASPAGVASGGSGVAVDDATAEPATQARPLPRPPNTPRASRSTVDKLIARYAKRRKLEPALVRAVVRAESNYNSHAVSHAGAVGLMQLMPATAADYGVRSVSALFDAETNMRVGTRHLKRLVSRFGIGKAVMAYNAGEGALERHRGFVTFPETQRYTHRVLTDYLRSKGVGAYSSRARQLTGVTLTPAMASIGRSGGVGKRGPLTPQEQARRMRKVDLSRLSLRVRPSLTDRALDPTMLDVGPASEPMFVLEAPDRRSERAPD